MKIADLIEELQKVQKHYPDIVVRVRDHTGSEQVVWNLAYLEGELGVVIES